MSANHAAPGVMLETEQTRPAERLSWRLAVLVMAALSGLSWIGIIALVSLVVFR